MFRGRRRGRLERMSHRRLRGFFRRLPVIALALLGAAAVGPFVRADVVVAGMLLTYLPRVVGLGLVGRPDTCIRTVRLGPCSPSAD